MCDTKSLENASWLAKISRLPSKALRVSIMMWEHPISAGLLALVFYSILAFLSRGTDIYKSSIAAYHNYLADAWLHGQLHLRVLPPSTVDLALYHNRYYLYWGPLSAAIMLPFVWFFGYNFSDTIVQIIIGSLNALLIALLLRGAVRSKLLHLSLLRRGLLVVVFTLGTACTFQTAIASVWATAVILALTCVITAYISAVCLSGWKSFLLCGCSIGAAILARNHVLLVCLWPVVYIIFSHDLKKWNQIIFYYSLIIVPVGIALGIVGLYNILRFDNIFVNGTQYQLVNDELIQQGYKNGLFSLNYLPRNLYYHFIAYPFPLSQETYFGGSLFLLTPVFFAIFSELCARWRIWSTWLLCVSGVLVLIPDLVIMGGGWMQFGPRYSLDYMVPLLLLTAGGLQRWPRWLFTACACISVIHYTIGVLVS